MDFGSILKMMGGGKGNPALEQLMIVSNMLGSLPKEEQTRIITNFVDELKKAVEENKNDKSKA